MTRCGTALGRAVSLRGWFMWSLLLAPIFGVLFFDTYLNVEIRRDDYRLSEINKTRAVLIEKLEKAQLREESLRAVTASESDAAEFALVKANPSQIQVVYWPFEEESRPDALFPRYDVAKAGDVSAVLGGRYPN